MKVLLTLVIIICITTISCRKETNYTARIQGNYKGSFKRNIYATTANVSLTFSGNGFRGDTDTMGYPVICAGTFSASEKLITFNRSCEIRTNIDGSLVLSGEYGYTLTADSLYISRYYPGVVGINDVYKLKKQ